MKISEFLKDKTLEIIFAIFLIITIIAFLSVTQVDLFIKMYIPIAILLFFIIVLTVEYIKKKKFYNAVKESLIELDEKYLIAETIENPSFLDGKLLKNILIETDKSMIEHVNKYKYLQEEYKEYIELWIHEIKTPIAAGKLIVQNNKNEVTKSIDEELDKIEYYVEQALYYARSNTVEKDYCITKCNLQDIVNTVIKKNKDDLINNKIKINIEDINENVYTDSKWIIFILNQIITNCIKYSKKENAEISIKHIYTALSEIAINDISYRHTFISTIMSSKFKSIIDSNRKPFIDAFGLFPSKEFEENAKILRIQSYISLILFLLLCGGIIFIKFYEPWAFPIGIIFLVITRIKISSA